MGETVQREPLAWLFTDQNKPKLLVLVLSIVLDKENEERQLLTLHIMFVLSL